MTEIFLNSKPISNELLLELIKDLNEISLSARAKNALLNLGCNYVGDIISLDQFELMRGKNLGRKSVTEIRNHLINSFVKKKIA